MVTDSLSNRLWRDHTSNKLYYDDGEIRVEVPYGLPIIVERLKRLTKLARKAAREIDTFYLKSTQENHVQSIHEDDHSLWLVRDELWHELNK